MLSLRFILNSPRRSGKLHPAASHSLLTMSQKEPSPVTHIKPNPNHEPSPEIVPGSVHDSAVHLFKGSGELGYGGLLLVLVPEA